MARAPAAWAEPSLGAALAGHSARAPCPHPASQSQPSPGRLPARRSRSQSAMLHREANGRVPLVAASRTETGSRRSSDAAARRRSSRWRGGAAAGRAAACPARLPLRANYGCAPTTDARFLKPLTAACGRTRGLRDACYKPITACWRNLLPLNNLTLKLQAGLLENLVLFFRCGRPSTSC